MDCSSLYATGLTHVQGVVIRRIGGCGHFPSRDKDGGQTVRSAMSENPLLYANFTALPSIEPELHCGNREFSIFLTKNSGKFYLFLFVPQKDVNGMETRLFSHKTRKSVKRQETCLVAAKCQ